MEKSSFEDDETAVGRGSGGDGQTGAPVKIDLVDALVDPVGGGRNNSDRSDGHVLRGREGLALS